MPSQIKWLQLFPTLGGSATKGVPDAGRLSILVDLPTNRESEFRAAWRCGDRSRNMPGSTPPATATAPATGEKKSFVVQIVEKRRTAPRLRPHASRSVVAMFPLRKPEARATLPL